MKELTVFQKHLRRYWRSSEWKAKRQKVLERDNFACVKCGKTRSLQVHHCGEAIKAPMIAVWEDGSKTVREDNFETYRNCPLSDLETLCGRCHMISDGHWEGEIKKESSKITRHTPASCPCPSKYQCKCECQCNRCRDARENPKPLPSPVPVSEEMKDWIRAEAAKL